MLVWRMLVQKISMVSILSSCNTRYLSHFFFMSSDHFQKLFSLLHTSAGHIQCNNKHVVFLHGVWLHATSGHLTLALTLTVSILMDFTYISAGASLQDSQSASLHRHVQDWTKAWKIFRRLVLSFILLHWCLFVCLFCFVSLLACIHSWNL